MSAIFSRKFFTACISLLSIVGYGFFVFAAAPTGGYVPGQTNDPNCAPGDTDCSVRTGWVIDAANGFVTNITDKIGIGTSTPVFDLTVDGEFKIGSDATGLLVAVEDASVLGLPVPPGTPLVGMTSTAGLELGGSFFNAYVGFPDGLYNLGITNGDFQHTLSMSGNNDGFEFASSEDSLANNQNAYFNIRPSVIDFSVQDGDTGTQAGSRFDSFGKVSLTTDTGTDTSEFFITDDFTWEKQSSLGTLMTLDGTSGNLTLDYDLEVLGDQVSVNSVPYYFPSTQGLSGTVLTNDGLGGLAWSMTSSLIGSTSGITSNPSPGLTTETWIGDTAGTNSASQVYTTFIGVGAGDGATGADVATFIGMYAGQGATNADNAIFVGQTAGQGAINAQSSIFMGILAGETATNANDAIFLGHGAGGLATNAQNSNFFGKDAGSGATSSSYSNFLGANAGSGATNAGSSNFFGYEAGVNATFATGSNFFGPSAGNAATSAYYSSFIGPNAGSGATNAARSIFIGYYAGASDTVDNRFGTPSSILIGNNTSTGGYSNSIAMGRSAVNTATNQFMIGSSTSPINTLRINGSAATECTITSGTGIACTSDERVKTNIVDLNTNTLDALLNIRTVSYNWLGNPTGKQQIGFLAQDLEQYFPQLVETDTDGMKSVYYAQMTPILVESLRELNIKVTDLQKVANGVDVTFIANLKNWLGNQANGITAIYADLFQSKKIQTDELCVGAVCVTQQQFMNVFGGAVTPQASTGPVIIDSSTGTSATTTDPSTTDPGTPPEEPDPVVDSTVTPPETPSEITP